MQPLTQFATESPPALVNDQQRSCSPTIAGDRASLLIGCYRAGDAANPEIYAAALIAVLCEYPEEVVAWVTDPRTGLPGRCQWLPTIFEVRSACEAEMWRTHQAQRRRDERKKADRILAERGDPRDRRPTFEQLADRYPGIIGQSKPRGLTPVEKQAVLADLERRKSKLKAPFVVSESLKRKLDAGSAPEAAS
jgi:hypothetical protein